MTDCSLLFYSRMITLKDQNNSIATYFGNMLGFFSEDQTFIFIILQLFFFANFITVCKPYNFLGEIPLYFLLIYSGDQFFFPSSDGSVQLHIKFGILYIWLTFPQFMNIGEKTTLCLYCTDYQSQHTICTFKQMLLVIFLP